MLLLALAVGCSAPSPGSDDDDDVSSDGGSDGASSTVGAVNCDTEVCVGAGTNVCCLELVLIPPMVDTRCVATLAECGAASRFECDEAADCSGGERCCLLDQSGGSGNTLIATCDPMCNLFQRELCQGHGTGSCAGGRFCCQAADSAYGSCEASSADCPT
jgi:hypothetical protein